MNMRPHEVTDEQIRNALTRRPDPHEMADQLAAIVARVERAPQRRRLLDWITGGSVLPRSASVLLAVLGLLVVLAFALAVAVGSRHRLPPPFGLARPGLIAFDLGGDVYVSNPDGTGRIQLTSGPDGDTAATWAPDGTRIAYESRQADLSFSLMVMDTDGRNRVTLADGLLNIGDIAWSPDSRRVAFGARIVGLQTSAYENYDYRLFVAQADRPGANRLGGPDVFGLEPSWSPDGTKIAFKRVYPCCGAPGEVALWLMSADGTNLRRLSSMPETYSNLGGGDAFWNTAW
jgi:hypothetical protein